MRFEGLGERGEVFRDVGRNGEMTLLAARRNTVWPSQVSRGTEVTRKIRDYKDLDVWQRAMELAAACWQIVHTAPRRSTTGIASQLMRAAESVSALIAEGHGRPTRQDYAHYVGQALGSVREVETHLLTLERVRGVRGRRVNLALSLNEECARMLTKLQRRLRES